MSVIVLNQSAIHYESLGRGRPVLFLHTWVGSWRYWVASLQAAAVSHSAYALDFYGFGDTARDSSQYSIAGQAELVGSFMDEMGIERVALVGHGLGALVGLRFAGMYPERVARFVAISLPLESGPAPESVPPGEPDQLLSILDPKGLHSAELLPEARSIAPSAMAPFPDIEEIGGACLRAKPLGNLRSSSTGPTIHCNGQDLPSLQPTLGHTSTKLFSPRAGISPCWMHPTHSIGW